MTTTDLNLSGFYADSVNSGLTITQDTLLDGIVADGSANIDLAVASITGETKAFTASKDTYVDVKADGTFTYIEETIDATAPALTVGSIRIAMVQTDGTEITAITDLRTMVGAFIFGAVTMVGASLRVYNPTSNPINIRYGAGSTSGGEPLQPYTAITVTETVYARPNRAGSTLTMTT